MEGQPGEIHRPGPGWKCGVVQGELKQTKDVTDILDYKSILTALRDEKAACQYAYGDMVPAFYTQALQKAIRDLEECRDCAEEAARMAEEINRK